MSRIAAYDRVMRRVVRVDGCDLWQGAKDRKGYGVIQNRGGARLAHRVVYEHHYGPRASSILILHSCDTPGCVRIEHLREGTPADNSADAVDRGRLNRGEQNPDRTTCAQGHPWLTPEDWYVRPLRHGATTRKCRECVRLRNLRRYDNHRDPDRCKYGHERTPENTYWRPDGRGRQCKPCRDRAVLRYRGH